MHLIIALLLSFIASSALGQTFEGKPKKIGDGDTFQFTSGTKIRLFGLDAPERTQKCEKNSACYECGQSARDALVVLIDNKEVVCQKLSKSFDRYVAKCAVDGVDVVQSMLGQGWGIAYKKYLKNKPEERMYLEAEADAMSAKKGIHAGNFIVPAEWRNKGARLQCELN